MAGTNFSQGETNPRCGNPKPTKAEIRPRSAGQSFPCGTPFGSNASFPGCPETSILITSPCTKLILPCRFVVPTWTGTGQELSFFPVLLLQLSKKIGEVELDVVVSFSHKLDLTTT